ncbi:MATE family efflux transporter [Anaerosacchariphilus polymeriproducens]|uniref:Probable multidrug resistance protein NorM n=1 Tax=Anaerosacchariphilus polymeriproducens TaxID=1812858 RepID=A0A371AUT8_9FIRM|nr:MATE family efflux transporter [Anaerosacchariphilus polymeriproducens]RDU23302.1 MATE family efflux transporter [Anaerosacchariphilus polymeriproducens]
MTDQNTKQDNKMGIFPIPKLLLSVSMPIVLSMLIQALYNIFDSAFVARIGPKALAAVSLTFPIQMLMISVSVGTGIGINALLSRSLGAGNTKAVNLAAGNGIFLNMINYLLFLIIGITCSTIYFKMQVNDPAIISYGKQYMLICTTFSFSIFLQVTFERLLQATGKTIYSMISQGTGAIVNIILDPILIFGLFGFPRLEVTGAAIATLIGQTFGMLMSFLFNITKNKEINLSYKIFKIDISTIFTIYSVGFPAIIMQSLTSLMTLGLNYILLMFSTTAVSVFGIYYKLQNFIFMPIYGLTTGMIPIIAYNYGAQNKKRILDTLKLSTYISVGIMSFGLIFFQLIPSKLLSIFNASSKMLNIGIPALRIISLSFIFAGICLTISASFQALGNGLYSLLVSIVRQILFLLPASFLFASFLGLESLWFAFPISEIAALIFAMYLFKRIFRKRLKNL